MNYTKKIDEYLNDGHNVMLTGAAGTGKTYTINHFTKNSIYAGKIACTALTGLASLHIKGNTIHRWAGTNIENKLENLPIIVENPIWKKRQRKAIQRAKVVIIDEISMMRSDYLIFLNRIFQIACNSKEPMGGKKIIFCGDFLQLAPIVRKEEKIDKIWAFETKIWGQLNIKIIELTKSQRQLDQTFSDALNEVRFGRCPEWVDNLFQARNEAPLNSSLTPIKFLAKNEQVDDENEKQIRMLPGKAKVFMAEIYADDEYQEKNILRDCIAPERLILKEGAQIMILKNDYQNNKYINGSMGTVYSIKRGGIRGVEVKIKLDLNNEIVTIFQNKWERKDEEGNVVAELYQLPLKLAYAITIHKSQGMTLDLVELDCKGIFAEGQMYVALSRVRDLKGLRLKNWNKKYIKANRKAVAFYDWLHLYYNQSSQE